jgi:hypothetical protein
VVGEGALETRLEPVTAEIEKAVVGPVAGGSEEDEEEEGTVDAGTVEEVRADEEEEDEDGGGVRGNKEEGEPTAELCVSFKVRLMMSGWERESLTSLSRTSCLLVSVAAVVVVDQA